MKYCIICRQVFLDSNTYCAVDGLRLKPLEESSAVQCIGCASAIEPGEKFCRRCGLEAEGKDWSTESGAPEPMPHSDSSAPEAKDEWQKPEAKDDWQKEVHKELTFEDDDLRLRPFRREAARAAERERGRRHVGLGTLGALVIVSLSLVAWQVYGPADWLNEFTFLPLRDRAPELPRELKPASLPQNDGKPTEPEKQTEALPPVEPAAPETAQSVPAALTKSESLSKQPTEKGREDGALSDPAGKQPEIGSDHPAAPAPPSKAGRRVDKPKPRLAEERTATNEPPVFSGLGGVRFPSPEEIQVKREEVERKRVQKQIQDAIANRGVNGVAAVFINGTVFLAGEVQTGNQKEAAEAAARRVPDVREVRSSITVKWPQVSKREGP